MSILKDLISIIAFLLLIIVLYALNNINLVLVVMLITTSVYALRILTLNKHFKKYLKNRTQMFEMMFNSSTDIILYRDLGAHIVECNTSLEQVLNLSKSELINKTLDQIFNRTLVGTDRVKNIIKLINEKTIEAIKTGKAVNFFEKFIFVNNRTGYYNVLIFPACNEHNEVLGSIIVARDVTTEYLTSKKAKDNEDRLNCILENMPICAFMKDKDGKFVIGSSPFEKFINCKNSDMKKLDLVELFGKEYIDAVKKEDENVYKTGKTFVTIRKVAFPNRTFWARIHKTPVFDEDGNINYLVIMFEDIENEREIELQKEYFIETLIHDLKIPTIAQLRCLELIRNEAIGKINIEQKELVTQIEGSCRYILDMISMVLKTYRLENGQKKLILETFDMKDLVVECFNEMEHKALDKNISFNCIVRADNEQIIDADRIDIKTLILNLLSNAIMYTNQDEMIIVEIQKDGDNIVVNIQSKGIILSERECSIFFEKMNTKTPRYTTIGHGIGLYLCKKIIESHNGQIFASTYKDIYNRFTFILPEKQEELLLDCVVNS